MVVVGVGVLLWYESQGMFTVPAYDPNAAPEPDPVTPDPTNTQTPFGPVMISQAQAVALQLASAYAGEFDVATIMGIIEHESSFIPNAFRMDRNGGSFGLMQMTAPAAAQVGYGGDMRALYDPALCVQLGCAYLAWTAAYLRQRQGGAAGIDEVIGAYNAGVGAALRGYLPLDYIGAVKAASQRWAQVLAQGVVA
jgi:soluble lytic murein transglycosylase-like protein